MALAPPSRKRAPRKPTVTVERQLLEEVLGLKDQVHLLATNIEHQTNAMGQTQMLVQRDVASISTKVDGLLAWRSGLDEERAEQRGAARMRKSLLAVVAALAGIAGGIISAVVNGWLRSGA